MRIFVGGSRDFTDYELLKSVLDKYEITKIITGDAKGADDLADQYARSKEHLLCARRYLAHWDKYGRFAGVRRTKDAFDNEEIDRCILFYSGKVTKGTKHTERIAEEHRVPVEIYGLPEDV